LPKNEKEFLNPYYFIALPDKKTEFRSDDGTKYTGKLTCELMTRTPLFIPNTSCDDAFLCNVPKHKSYDFYSYQELQPGEGKQRCHEPVLPGSEIRGMLRSVFEAVSGSCLSMINDDMLITNRCAPDARLKPGLLKREKDGIVLIPATAAYVEKENVRKLEFQDGEKVFFETEQRNRLIKIKGNLDKKRSTRQQKEGYLLCGELDPPGIGSKKNYAAVFSPAKGSAIPYDAMLQQKMQEILDAYQKDSGLYQNYGKAYSAFLQGTGEGYFPLYYSEEKDERNRRAAVHVSPACITKKSYEKRVRDLAGQLQPCQSADSLCPACALFGMVQKNYVRASKLRFADGRVRPGTDVSLFYEKPITLEELASPHVSNAQMYLQRPSQQATEWNYDYWVEGKGDKRKIHFYRAKLNGRKFYWHHCAPVLQNAEKTERNVTVRPLKPGVTFFADIYFDNISEQQLQQLVYLCNISADGTMGYKLGMGKPLGLGSIAMRVRSMTLRQFDPTVSDFYKETVIDFSQKNGENPWLKTYQEVGFVTEKHIAEQFSMLMDFTSTDGATISYPYTEQQVNDTLMKEGFKWFGNNTQSPIQALNTAAFRPGRLPYLQPNRKADKKSGGKSNTSHSNRKGKGGNR